MTPGRLVGVVLAGGRSSRMGRDKAMLEIDGATLLDRAVARLREAGADPVLVSGDRADHAGIRDDIADRGPVGGIASILGHCDGDALLVVPVDMPRLDASTLRRLRDGLAGSSAACFDGHPLPWAARLDHQLRDAVAQALVACPGGPSMRQLHESLQGVVLPPPPRDVLGNVNTPADWRTFER